MVRLIEGLVDHPGVVPALVFTLAGWMAGVSRGSVKAGLIGMAIMGVLCWTPVLVTAWVKGSGDD